VDVKITQVELEEIDQLTRDIGWRTKRLDEVKSSVKAMLLHHISIEPGRFTAKLRKQVCRNVPWKSLVIEKLGEAMADWFKKLYPPHVRFEVEVVEHAIMPLWKNNDDSEPFDIN
jgi:hypothetical protein